MNVAVYFIILWLLIIMPAIRRRKKRRHHRRKRGIRMTNQQVLAFVGKKVAIYGDNVNEFNCVINSVEENWLQVELRNGKMKLLNLDYVYSIEEIVEKKKKNEE